MDDRPVGRPKKENPMIKRWIFLDKTGYEAVRVRASALGTSFSAYVRKLIQDDIGSNTWKK